MGMKSSDKRYIFTKAIIIFIPWKISSCKLAMAYNNWKQYCFEWFFWIYVVLKEFFADLPGRYKRLQIYCYLQIYC